MRFTTRMVGTVLRFVVHDAGAPVTPGDGCVGVDPHTVECTPDPWADGRMSVDLGDGDDVLQATATTSMIVNGGAGDDVLFGGSAWDRINGGGGADVIRGNGGNDELTDGDTDVGATPNADHLDGGDGEDVVSYERRTKPVFVDLADARPDGAAGERDLLAGIEDVNGGSGDDRLAGNGAGNRLVGGRGENDLVGRGGGDWLFTRAGSVDCGSGADLVRQPTRHVMIRRSCEQISLPAGNAEPFLVRPLPKMTRKAIVFSFSIGEETIIEAMTVRAAARRRLVLARSPRGLADQVLSGSFKIRLRWTETGRRLIGGGSVRVVVHLDAFAWSMVLPMRAR